MLTSESTLSVFLSIRKPLSVQVQQMEGGYTCVVLRLAIISSAEFSVWHLAKDSILVSHSKMTWLPHKIKNMLLPRHRQKTSGDRGVVSLQFTRYLPCPQARSASGKNFRNLGKCLCVSHYDHIPSRKLGRPPTTALLLNSYGTTALEVML